MDKSKKITRVGANGKPYSGVLAEFTTPTGQVLSDDSNSLDLLVEQDSFQVKKSKSKKKGRKNVQKFS